LVGSFQLEFPFIMTEQRLNPDLTINELLLRYPTAVTVLNAHAIDTCCGGGSSIAEAAAGDGIDLDELLAALRQAASKAEVA
jgi:iron-sulfur cluster repair protein YtfE (RIC family)